MAIECDIQVKEGYLHVHAWGQGDSMEEVQQYGLKVVEAAAAAGIAQALCDEREVEYHVGELEMYECARLMAEVSPPGGKAAIVYDAAHLEIGQFWETVAVNRGLTVRAFTNIEDAENWLHE